MRFIFSYNTSCLFGRNSTDVYHRATRATHLHIYIGVMNLKIQRYAYENHI